MRHPSLAALPLVLALGCASPRSAPQASAAASGVGVRTELLLDRTRHGADPSAARPVQLTVWYPARVPGDAPRLTAGDYFDLAVAERGPATDSARLAARRELGGFLAQQGMSDSGAALFAAPMLGVRDAPPVAGRRPLVVIVQGNGQSAADQNALGETLARAGYVVATMPSYTRISHPPSSESELGTGAEEQADDIAFVVAAASRRADVDADRVALVAHSLGARGALLYAMRAPVRALVSLDGGIGTASGRTAMEQAPSFAPRGFATPVLHVYETLDPFMAPDFTLLRELSAADVELVRVPAMHHHHFTSLGALGARVAGLAAATRASDTTAVAWETVAAMTAAFLDEHVRGEGGGFARAAELARARIPAIVVEPLGAAR